MWQESDIAQLPSVNKESITDNKYSIKAHWKGRKAKIEKKKKKNSRSFDNINSELLIRCRVVCCTAFGYHDLLVSNNPQILLLLQCKII